MKTQFDSLSNTADSIPLSQLSCSKDGGHSLRDIASKLLLGVGALVASTGKLEAHAREPDPSPLVEADKKELPKAIRTSFEVRACAESYTLLSDKGICYVTDLKEDQSYVRVSIAAGVVVNKGELVIGGSFKSVLGVTIDYPLGTDRKDAIAAAKKQFKDKLNSDQGKKELKKLGLDYKKIEEITEIKDKSKDKSWLERLKKALENIVRS